MIIPVVESSPLRSLREAVELAAGGLLDLGVDELAAALYAGWYAGWLGADALPLTDPSEPWIAATAGLDLVPGGSRDLTAALRAAHAGSRVFATGWRADRVSSAGRVLASCEKELRVLDATEYVAEGRPALPPRIGGELAAVRRRDSVEVSPGYWLTVGDAWTADDEPHSLVRIYWNVRGDDAPALVAALTRALLDGPPTWALKLPLDLAQHVRRDAAVVYLPREDFAVHAPALAATADALRDVLLPDEPALTLRLAPGVGLAEDPAGDDSFGTSRCALVARGLAAASRDDADGLLAAVLERFCAVGLDPERPHLEPGSDRLYDWTAPLTTRPTVLRAAPAAVFAPPPPLSAAETGDFLDGAQAIAGQLVAEAIWHEDRCTWVGDAVLPDGARWTVAARSCEGDLYGGTAGVGRFLAQYAAATADEAAARTAAGALRHALTAARRGQLARGGLFLGPVGSAWTALESAEVLDDPALRTAGRALARDAAAAIAGAPVGESDLLGGEAGAIIGLLAVEEAAGEDVGGMPAALAAADRLLAAAERSGLGWHWPGPADVALYGLCGLAHGTSGIALAFLALYGRTREAAHLETARRALAYERRWYLGEAVGWPDLRELTGTDLALGRGLAHPALWCHGAVGAGLVRLVAFAASGEPADLAEAGAALQASRAAAAQSLRVLAEARGDSGHAVNWSLCHGLLGTAELMLRAAEQFGEPAHLHAARRLGERALADRGSFGAWRCGVPDAGETPGLLLGLAGIGATLLRLHDTSLAPSPVLPGVDRAHPT